MRGGEGMIKVMLVDDEVLAVQYMEQIIDWEKEGYQIVGSAFGGRQAIEMYDKYHPDIVISDIRMPGMDGLELTKKLKEKDKEVTIILMSAYKDFEYAKKGIQYGVSNYLLKHEIQEETILSELNQIRKKIKKEEERKKVYQKYLIRKLISGEKGTEELEEIKEIQIGNRLFLLLLHKSGYIQNGQFIEEEWSNYEKDAVEKILEEEGAERCRYVSDVQITGNNWLILYQLDAIASRSAVNSVIKEKTTQIIKKLLASQNVHVQILYSNEISLDEISGIFRKMAWQIRYAWFWQVDKAYELERDQVREKIEREYLGEEIQKLRDAFYEEDTDIEEMIQKWFEKINGKQQLEDCRVILPFLEQFFREVSEKTGESIAIRKTWSVWEAGMYYAEQLKRMQNKMREWEKKNYSRLVLEVMQYLQKHYNEDVSLDTLGEVFQMNGSYLGRIVRKETGSTILKHVTNLRMEKAKQFLREKNYTVSETAYQVGYQTSQYFSQIFMKTVGVSPQEYKRWEEKNQRTHS